MDNDVSRETGVQCLACGGSGKIPYGDREEKCPICYGTGHIDPVKQAPLFIDMMSDVWRAAGAGGNADEVEGRWRQNAIAVIAWMEEQRNLDEEHTTLMWTKRAVEEARSQASIARMARRGSWKAQ